MVVRSEWKEQCVLIQEVKLRISVFEYKTLFNDTDGAVTVSFYV